MVSVTLLIELLNTSDARTGRDVLTDSAALTEWLSARASGRDGWTEPPSIQEVALAVEVREALRALLLEGCRADASAGARETLNRAAGLLGVDLGFGAAGLGLQAGGLNGVLARVLVEAHTAIADETWERIGVCGNPDCRRVFLDRSRNRSRLWCSMKECGNRMKARRFRRKNASRPRMA